jgi:hypothetical protein
VPGGPEISIGQLITVSLGLASSPDDCADAGFFATTVLVASVLMMVRKSVVAIFIYLNSG